MFSYAIHMFKAFCIGCEVIEIYKCVFSRTRTVLNLLLIQWEISIHPYQYKRKLKGE